MGEEGTEFRLAQLEKNVEKTEKAIDTQAENISKIKEISIAQNIKLKYISASVEIIKYTFIVFVVSNVLMYFSKK